MTKENNSEKFEGIDDPFSRLHSLLKTEKFDQALHEVLNVTTGRIKAPYTSDANHAWYIVGDIYSKTEQLEEAADAFRKALRSRHDDCQALFALGYCYSEMGVPTRAIRVLLKAILFGGPKEEYLYNLGNAYFDTRCFDKAIKAYEDVVAGGGELSALAIRNIVAAREKLRVNAEKSARRKRAKRVEVK